MSFLSGMAGLASSAFKRKKRKFPGRRSQKAPVGAAAAFKAAKTQAKIKAGVKFNPDVKRQVMPKSKWKSPDEARRGGTTLRKIRGRPTRRPSSGAGRSRPLRKIRTRSNRRTEKQSAFGRTRPRNPRRLLENNRRPKRGRGFGRGRATAGVGRGAGGAMLKRLARKRSSGGGAWKGRGRMARQAVQPSRRRRAG